MIVKNTLMSNTMSYYLIYLFTIILTASASEFHPLSEEFIDETNLKAVTWKAKKNFDISEWERVKKLASGSIKPSKNKVNRQTHNTHNTEEELPESFDSATRWPKCKSIQQIRDQSKCGSCWAFAAVEAMSDRICIHSNQEIEAYISALDLLSCCPKCGGCHGGDNHEAWIHWETNGIVTGGLYNHTEQGCKPYFLPECDNHPVDCKDFVESPKCVKKCVDSSVDYKAALTYGQNTRTFNGEKQIMMEIFKNGPLQVHFDVPADFLIYHRGIYIPTSKNIIGGHSVKMVGWGVENGVKYWKVANSWNSRWGENGYFRIIRGINSCDIEEYAIAGLPLLDNKYWEPTVIHYM